MGDRGNIVLTGADNFPHRVYLYTHWRGSDMKQILAKALERGKSRWSDGSYLARVIFQDLIGEDTNVTGFGLSAVPGDNEYPYLVVDVDANTVWREDDPRKGFEHIAPKAADTKPVSFADFITAETKGQP